MGGGEVVAGAVDGLEVCVEAVCCAEEDGLVDCHCEDDGLGEEDFEGACHAVCEFCFEGAVVLGGGAVVCGGGGVLVVGFAGFEDDGGVGFF